MLLSGLSRLMLITVSHLSSSRQQGRPTAGTAHVVLDIYCICAVTQVASQSSQTSEAQPSGNSDTMLTLSVYNPPRVLSVSDMCNLPGPQLFAIWTVSYH